VRRVAADGPASPDVAPAPQLRVSDNGRWLQYRDGKPFFYLADTAWQLFHRLDREQADRYLRDRAEKGFTVIQAVALAELDGLNTPNAYGHRPLRDNDPRRPDVRDGPDNDYWDHVDDILARARSLNLFLGLLPTWGDKWQGGGQGPLVFDRDNARVFGQWLGERYRTAPIIWILGGDRNITGEADRQLIAAMARGLREGDGGAHLITYHPRGPGRSSDYFHHAPWLDFNMFQSSHAARDHDNGLFAEHDYRLQPPKPTLDGEPRYEALRVGFYNRGGPRNVYFDDDDARQAAWWSVLAGACGHTYGNGNIWQMWQPGRAPVLGANVPWQQALDHPGAFQMGHLRQLLCSRPFWKLAPDDTLLLDGPARGGGKVRAARAADGSFALAYSPRGEQFSVQMSRLAPQVRATWFDPRYGTAYHLHTSDNAGIQTFVPPTRGRGQDWVLVLDDAQAGYPPAGQDTWQP
jgi:hypothetical protein